MPVNWDDFDKKVDKAISDAGKRTDERLAVQIAGITRMTAEEVQTLFPLTADAEKVARLMRVVKESGDRNTKVNNILGNAEEFAGVVLTLLERFV